MRIEVDSETLEGALERVAMRDPRVGEDARAAVEWLTAADDDAPLAFSRRHLQLFLWYELPRKWLMPADEHVAVADALASFFDELGVDAGALAALCRAPETLRLLRDGATGSLRRSKRRAWSRLTPSCWNGAI